MQEYYSTWILQGITQAPNPFPPPPPFINQWGDAREIQGMFRQDQTTEALNSDAFRTDTRGRFAHHPSENLQSGDVLRHAETGMYIRLLGDPLIAPGFSPTQIQTWKCYVTSRQEEDALLLSGGDRG